MFWVKFNNKNFINKFNVWFKKLKEKGSNIWNKWLIFDKFVIVDNRIIIIFVKYNVVIKIKCVIFCENNWGKLLKNWLIFMFVCCKNKIIFVIKGVI